MQPILDSLDHLSKDIHKKGESDFSQKHMCLQPKRIGLVQSDQIDILRGQALVLSHCQNYCAHLYHMLRIIFAANFSREYRQILALLPSYNTVGDQMDILGGWVGGRGVGACAETGVIKTHVSKIPLTSFVKLNIIL